MIPSAKKCAPTGKTEIACENVPACNCGQLQIKALKVTRHLMPAYLTVVKWQLPFLFLMILVDREERKQLFGVHCDEKIAKANGTPL